MQLYLKHKSTANYKYATVYKSTMVYKFTTNNLLKQLTFALYTL